MKKTLTIVIPTYNMEKYLHKCLDSLVICDKEQFMKLEVLVINDGSKDSSSAIAHNYQDKYPNVFRVIDKENGNYGSCVNRGLKEATGKYIKILDADDSFDTDNFMEFLITLAGVDADLIISDFDIVSDSGLIKKSFSYPLNSKLSLNSSDFFTNLKEMQMHAVTYKCENLRKIGYFQTEGVSYTDLEWIFYPMTTVRSIYYFNKVVYKYLIGRVGQTVDISVYHRKVLDRVKGAKSMISEFNNISDTIYKDYLKCQLLGRLEGIYLSCLIVIRDDSFLKEFDEYLKNEVLQEIYLRLDDSNVNKMIKYKYIREWRRTNKLPSLSLKFIYLFIKKMQTFVE